MKKLFWWLSCLRLLQNKELFTQLTGALLQQRGNAFFIELKGQVSSTRNLYFLPEYIVLDIYRGNTDGVLLDGFYFLVFNCFFISIINIGFMEKIMESFNMQWNSPYFTITIFWWCRELV